ncbi:MAG: hypothetical protein ACKVT1_16530 [Dehalococcoidia bacterium]
MSRFNPRTLRRSLAVTGALVMLAASLTFATIAFVTPGQSQDAREPLVPASPATPTPVRVAEASDPVETLKGRWPEALPLIADITAGRTAALLNHFSWLRYPCEEAVSRGVSDCERKNIPTGTVLEAFRTDGHDGRVARVDISDSMDYLLRGRNPRLALAAERDGNELFLLFALDPAPGLMFPGREPEGGSPVVAVWFVLSGRTQPLIIEQGYQNAATPPLEFVHYEERQNLHKYTILAASAEFKAREDANFKEIEDARRQP